jgi:hypothetical protein
MMILDNLALFLRIVEKGGLAAAGRELGLSAASVSERLVSLEKYYGAALLHRTTRAISLPTFASSPALNFTRALPSSCRMRVKVQAISINAGYRTTKGQRTPILFERACNKTIVSPRGFPLRSNPQAQEALGEKFFCWHTPSPPGDPRLSKPRCGGLN